MDFSQAVSRPRTAVQSRLLVEGGQWFFNIGLALFLAVLIFSGGLFAYQYSLGAKQSGLEQRIRDLEADLSEDSLADLVTTSTSLAAARQVLSNHIYPSLALAFLAGHTHPRVYYNAFDFSADGKKISVAGFAQSYRIVAEQISILESARSVERVDFGGLAASERGIVSFRLTIGFRPELLRPPAD